jgi:hypothetical protein
MMHPDMERELAAQRIEELRRAGEAAGRPVLAAPAEERVVIRVAARSDRAALTALAAIDSALPPIGDALVAEIDGALVAALPLGGGLPFADPFRRTKDVIALLEARARQVERERRGARGHGRFAWLAPAALRRLV